MRVYIHIPFCKRKCLYCKFPTLIGFSQEQKEEYLVLLRQEMQDFFSTSQRESIQSIYFGGGTPSLLSIDEISTLLDIVRHPGQMSDGCEISIELHPEDVSKPYLKGLHALGINRVSLGVQTLNAQSLDAISRVSLTSVE